MSQTDYRQSLQYIEKFYQKHQNNSKLVVYDESYVVNNNEEGPDQNSFPIENNTKK